MLLFVLDDTARAAALAFNGPPFDGDHLPLNYGVNPIAIGAPDPYAYAGKYILPTGLATNTHYAVMWNFLATLPTADIDPDEAWPDDQG
jgi:hypothetical protein